MGELAFAPSPNLLQTDLSETSAQYSPGTLSLAQHDQVQDASENRSCVEAGKDLANAKRIPSVESRRNQAGVYDNDSDPTFGEQRRKVVNRVHGNTRLAFRIVSQSGKVVSGTERVEIEVRGPIVRA